MKKLVNKVLILTLPCFLLFACGENPVSSTEESNDSINQTTSSVSEILTSENSSSDGTDQVVTLNIFDGKVHSSRPTCISNRQVYTYEPIGQTLLDTSTMEIQYGDVVKTKYEYSRQYLNSISEDNPIKTKTGVIYSSGSSVYKVVNDELVLVEEVEKIALLGSLNIQRAHYFSSYELSDDYFKGFVKDDYIEDVIGDIFNIHNLSIEIELEDNQISKLRVSYTTDIEANVTFTSRYTYNEIEVIIPSNE